MNKMCNNNIQTFFSVFLICILLSHLSLLYGKDPHCLWLLSSRKSTLYFLGSIHVLSNADYPLDSCIENAYEQSRVVYFEVDMDSASSVSAQQKIMMAGMLKDRTLADVLSDSTYQMLSRELTEYGIKIDLLSGLKPWMVATMLTIAKFNALGISQQHGVDRYFYSRAKADGRQVRGMETIDDQIRCFNALDDELEDEIVLEAMQSLDEIESEFLRLKKAWKTGQVAIIDSVMNKHMNEYPELKKILLKERNKRWAQHVERMIENKENALIIVGTGHLVGEDSLIDILRNRGYRIRQM